MMPPEVGTGHQGYDHRSLNLCPALSPGPPSTASFGGCSEAEQIPGQKGEERARIPAVQMWSKREVGALRAGFPGKSRLVPICQA